MSLKTDEVLDLIDDVVRKPRPSCNTLANFPWPVGTVIRMQMPANDDRLLNEDDVREAWGHGG